MERAVSKADSEAMIDRHGVPASETLFLDRMPPEFQQAELEQLIAENRGEWDAAATIQGGMRGRSTRRELPRWRGEAVAILRELQRGGGADAVGAAHAAYDEDGDGQLSTEAAPQHSPSLKPLS